MIVGEVDSDDNRQVKFLALWSTTVGGVVDRNEGLDQSYRRFWDFSVMTLTVCVIDACVWEAYADYARVSPNGGMSWEDKWATSVLSLLS